MSRSMYAAWSKAHVLLLAPNLSLDVSEWSMRFRRLYTIDRSVKQELDPETRPVCFRYVGLRQLCPSRPSLVQTTPGGN
jgi:hypothetical protein